MNTVERLFFGILISVCLITVNPDWVVVLAFYVKNRIILISMLELFKEIISAKQLKTVEVQERRVQGCFREERRFQYPDGTVVEERIFRVNYDIAS